MPLRICHTVFSKCHIVLKYLWPCFPTLKSSSHLLFNADGLKVWSTDLWGFLSSFQGICKVTTVFKVILRYSWSFSLSFSHECAVEFSGNFMTCDITTDWIPKQMRESSCFLLSQILKRLQKCETVLSFLLFFLYCRNCNFFIKIMLAHIGSLGF